MEHDRSPLAAYVLGALDPGAAQDLDTHLIGCDACQAELAELRALEEALGEVPPEAFLDGPPEGGDLLLQRTLRRVRAERGQFSRPRRLLMAAGVAGMVAAALAGGALIGRSTAPPVQAGPPPSASVGPTAPSTAPPVPPGTVALAAKDPKTGASMTGALTPAAGWVRVHVKVEGVRAGVRCRLVVVPKSGTPVEAGSWLVSPLGEKQGTTLDAAALVAPANVASVDVVTFDGRRLASTPV